MEAERVFRGVWIPAELWLHPELSPTEMKLAAEIHSLDKPDNGCFASNDYFKEFLKLKSVQHVSGIISKLITLKLVYIESFDGRTRVLRSNIKVGYVSTDTATFEVKDPSEKKKSRGKKVTDFAELEQKFPFMKHEKFIPLWERWRKFRKEKGAPLVLSTEDAQLSKWTKKGFKYFEAVVNRSIEMGWTGLFDLPKEKEEQGQKEKKLFTGSFFD